jgi:glycosyltransferase involved in cell wall biosynthesis
MRILQFAGYFFPEKAASIYLEENRYEAFSEAGFKTIVYAARPQRGLAEEEYQEYKHKKLEIMYNGGVEVHRFAMYREGKNAILRALRYFLISVIQFWKGIWAKDIDLIYVASTPPTQGALAALVKKLKRVPFVYNLQDIFPDSLAGTGLAKKDSLLWKIGRVIEDFTYRNADKIIVISEDFKKNIMSKGVPEEKIEVIYNWVDEEAVVNVPREKNVLFDRYNLDRKKFYITYSGNIGLTQNMDMLLDVMREMMFEAPDLRLVLIGEGAYKESVVKKIDGQMKENGSIWGRTIQNVVLLPFQPYDDISHVFSLGDAGLVISKPGVGANSVPSKTWSIMSASRPVLANFDENELKDIIANKQCGIFTKAGDKKAFKSSILEFYHHPELCKEYGMNGRQFVMDNLTKAVGTQKYLDVIKSFEKVKN